TRITKNHNVEDHYISAVLKEWELRMKQMPDKVVIKDLHLGGGTPTFFSPANITRLINGINQNCLIANDAEFGFEGHPNNTTDEHLETMYDLGFRRVSFGIQDFDERVQRLINRIQPYENVRRVTESARSIGYESINYDLIYGLPGQTMESMETTMEQTIDLNPDRIALYGYAHVPGIKPAQRVFESQLPIAKERADFYQFSKKILTHAGYHDIGMDHFAKTGDTLHKAAKSGTLHRNFMGYSTQSTRLQIGLGVSAISDAWTAFSQNEKVIEQYYQRINKGEVPAFKGHILNRKDLTIRQHILNLMCRYQTQWHEEELNIFGLDMNFDLLESLQEDELIHVDKNGLEIKDKGKPFVRNICMTLDARLNNGGSSSFSKTI
ncbi:MAG: oxygen-independent coproporphyrinogen III oxidase, partial [Bacteroidota bacterium]